MAYLQVAERQSRQTDNLPEYALIHSLPIFERPNDHLPIVVRSHILAA